MFLSVQSRVTLISCLLLTLFTTVTFAGSRSFEAAVSVPWTFIETSLSRESKEVRQSFQVPQKSFNFQEIPVLIFTSNVYVDMVLKPTEMNQTEVVLQSERLAVDAHVGGIFAKGQIKREIGGVPVIIDVEAKCEDFHLIQNSANLSSTWVWQNNGDLVEAKLKDLTLQWHPGSWQIQGLKCVGPIGFADVLEQEIQKQLADAAPFMPELRKYLEENLNSEINGQLKPWMEQRALFQYQGLTYYNRLVRMEVEENKGILLHTLVQPGPGREDAPIPLNLSRRTIDQLSDKPVLILPTAAMQMLAHDQSQRVHTKMRLNNNSAFRSLLRSRLIQLFVWPDLWGFKSTAPFDLISKLQKDVAFTFGSGSKGTVKGHAESWLQASRRGQMWDYLYLKTRFQGEFNYALKRGALTLGFQLEDMNTQVSFFPAYVKKFQPNRHISVSRLNSAVEGSLVFQSMKIEIPEITPVEGMRLRAEKLTRPSKDHFFIEWQDQLK